MRELVLIEAPSNLGLKEPMPGVEPGVKFFPAAMEKEGLAEKAGIKTKLHKTTLLILAITIALLDIWWMRTSEGHAAEKEVTENNQTKIPPGKVLQERGVQPV